MDVSIIFSLVSTLISLLVTVGGGFYFFGALNESVKGVKDQLKELKNEVNGKFNSFEGKLDSLSSKVDTNKDDLIREIRTIEVSFTEIKMVVFSSKKVNKGLMANNSPLKLTDEGISLLTDSGGDKYVDKYFDSLTESMRSLNPKSAYDVQSYTLTVLTPYSSQDDFIPIKDYIYKKGYSLEDVLSVMCLHLRDKALPKFGFHIDELDNHENKDQPNPPLPQNPM